jgi:hypothetical protein
MVGRLIVLDAAAEVDNAESLGDGGSESDVLELFLAAAGIDIGEQSLPLNYQQVEALVHQRAPEEFSLPPRQLVDIMVENMAVDQSMRVQHVPDIFDGDMIIFSAKRGNGSSPLMDTWRRYVAGDIAECPVDCTHEQMLNTESLKSFGELLALHLR